MADDDEQQFADKVVKYSTIGNLEQAKRDFSDKKYDEFDALIKAQTPPFKFFNVKYADASEFNGRPDFILVNKNKGFIQSMDDYRKYFFIAFVCSKKDSKASFNSYWVVNTTDDLQKILGSDYDSFKFTETTDVQGFLGAFRTGGVDNPLSMLYLK